MKRFVKAVGGMNHSVIYTNIDGKHFRFFGGTWAWRNHNPGNLRPKQKGKFRNQIGATHSLAIFPNDELGHVALLKLLRTAYGNDSIHKMIYIYAPPSENPTKKYEKYLHETTGVMGDKKIKDFTPTEFKKFWEAIQHFEGFRKGKIVEMHRIIRVKELDKNLYQYYLDSGDTITEEKCIRLAKQGKVELEVCFSDLGNIFLRSPPNSCFQKKLGDLKK